MWERAEYLQHDNAEVLCEVPFKVKLLKGILHLAVQAFVRDFDVEMMAVLTPTLPNVGDPLAKNIRQERQISRETKLSVLNWQILLKDPHKIGRD